MTSSHATQCPAWCDERDVGTLASAALTETRELIGARLRLATAQLPEPTRLLVARHFGWDECEDAGVGRIGKCLRAALVMLTARAAAGTDEQALPAAVAVELIHNASLLHDDIIDGDLQRRGKPALWAVEGVPAAILAGDALFFAAIQVLVDTPTASRLVPVLLDSVQVLIEGEYRDTVGSLKPGGRDVDPTAAISVAAAKTGELMGSACALGALVAGTDSDRVDHLRRFGRHLGIAFQCVDDMLNIWSEEAVTGKPAQSDLRERKATIPVATALAAGGPEAAALRSLLRGSGPLGDDDCAQAVDLIEQTGAKALTLALAHSQATEALRNLKRAEPLPMPAAQLAAITQVYCPCAC